MEKQLENIIPETIENKNLNVKVGDVVLITDKNGFTDYITKVVKVLPNGRFRTEYDTQYWKANGTRNTKAKKYERNRIAKLGNEEHFVQYLRTAELPKFLKQIADTLGNQVRSIDNLVVISKFFEIFGYKQSNDINQMIERVNQFDKGSDGDGK